MIAVDKISIELSHFFLFNPLAKNFPKNPTRIINPELVA